MKDLHGMAKLQYIWDYYKLPIAVACILIYIAGYTVYGHIARKDRPLYLAFVNVTAGERLTQRLGSGFLDYAGLDPSKNQVYLYTGLYLTADPDSSYHEYTYASRMKILAAMDAEQIDIVLANREAFDAFAEEGYLYDLNALLAERDPRLYRRLSPYLVSRDGENGEMPAGIALSQSPFFREAGFDGDVFLGVIGNSPRLDMVTAYLNYLFS